MDDSVKKLVEALLSELTRIGYPVQITNQYQSGHLEAVIVLPDHHWRAGKLVRKETK